MTAPGTTTRSIVTAPASVLRASARHVRVPDRAIDRLVAELFAIMRAARGVGLAAPQIEVDHLAGRLYSDLVGPDDLIDTTLHPTPPQPGERGAAP